MTFKNILKSIGNIVKLSNSFFAVVVLIQVLLISLTLIFYNIINQQLKQDEQDRINDVVAYVNNQLSQSPKRALLSVLPISDNTTFAQILAEANREELATATKPTWENIKLNGIAVFDFFIKPKNSPDWVYFYRAHNPQKFGETTQGRPLINKSIETHAVISGLEQGHSGYSFRAAAPVYFNGVQVGVVETGMDMGDSFLEILRQTYPGNWGAYNLARGMKSVDDKVLINAIGPGKDKYFSNLLPNKTILAQINDDKTTFELNEKTSTVSLYIPVKNFQGDIVLIIKYVTATNYFDELAGARNNAFTICLIGLILSSLIIYALFKMITSPIKKLIIETDKIKAFQLDEPIKIESSLTEVKGLIDSMESMKIGLQSFRKFIPAQLVRQLIESKQEATVSGQRRNLTVFFSDVADFTSISEKMTPNELADQLSEYLSEMTSIIVAHGGTVDKYIGDAIMAFWGAPIEMGDHANKACLAALACQQRARQLALKWASEGKPIFKMRVGINTGEIVVGNIGSTQRLSYTVLGDAVNLASRLEGLNKQYNTSVLIGQNTLEELPADFAFRLIDIVVVKGKTELVPIYELVALKGDITSLDAEFLKLFSKAVNYYVDRDWSRARGRFTQLLESKPGDIACEIFIRRCDEYEKNPPPENWAGEYVYKQK